MESEGLLYQEGRLLGAAEARAWNFGCRLVGWRQTQAQCASKGQTDEKVAACPCLVTVVCGG